MVLPVALTFTLPLAFSVKALPLPRPARVLSPVSLWAKTPCALTALTDSGFRATALASVAVLAFTVTLLAVIVPLLLPAR